MTTLTIKISETSAPFLSVFYDGFMNAEFTHKLTVEPTILF